MLWDTSIAKSRRIKNMAESAIKATPDMCAFCFDTIIGHFKNKKVTAPSSYDTISWFEPLVFLIIRI